MNILQQLLFSISVLGAFNGLALSLYLFLQKKDRSPAPYLMGVFLLATSVRVGELVFYEFEPSLPKNLHVYLSALYLTGPALYYFFRAVREKRATAPSSWKRSWMLQLGLYGALLIFIPYAIYPLIWQRYIGPAVYLQWLVYLVLTTVLVWELLPVFFRSPRALSKTEKFLVVLLFGNVALALPYLTAFLIRLPGIYTGAGLLFSLFFYLALTYYFYQASGGLSEATRSERKPLPPDDVQRWLGKLEAAVVVQMCYKDPNLKLEDLARQIGTGAHQLSQLLNEQLGKSFSAYINEYRIEAACEMIVAHNHLTFEAIGYASGYNSKSTFYAAFKKVKGITPAQYQNKLKKQLIS